jgi:acyl-coenzyme A thioesterase PaaI-like protein
MDQGDIFQQFEAVLREKLGESYDEYAFPPPVFEEMEGEFLELDLESGTLTARFPVREKFFNPYHTLQGGMVAAAADNTLGPLSVLVAPPNLTRRMEITYARPVTADVGRITVKARFLERNESLLYFRADLYDPEGQRLARVKATHWIMADPPGGR